MELDFIIQKHSWAMDRHQPVIVIFKFPTIIVGPIPRFLLIDNNAL